MTRQSNTRRLLRWVGTAAFVLVVAPPLVNLVVPENSRSFDAVELEDTVHTEIRFKNEEQNLDLAGLLFKPSGDGPFPAAVIIHGSGTSRRDSGWYLTVVSYLQKQGVVVLLPDKRGSEESEGDWRTSSFDDLATDTMAAVTFLENQTETSISTIGIIGMSQGGRIAPIVAANDGRIAWVVSVVGPAVTGRDQLYFEEVHNLRGFGFLPIVSDLLAFPSSWMLMNVTDAQFWNSIGNQDPIEDWARVNQPTLVLLGELDTNVPTKATVDRLENLGKANIAINVYDGSGHAIEDPPGRGDSIFRRDALDGIVEFIRNN